MTPTFQKLLDLETKMSNSIDKNGINQVALALHNACTRDLFKNRYTQKQLDQLFQHLEGLLEATKKMRPRKSK